MTKAYMTDILYTTLHINMPESGRSEIQARIADEIGHTVEVAIDNVKSTGITFEDEETGYSNAEADLIIMYSVWLYGSKNEDKPMPRSLQYALNNMLFKQKAGTQNG